MAKNRFNTVLKAVPDYAPRKSKTEEVVLIFENCCVCHKPISEGYYGRWGTGGACSKTCNNVKEKENENLLPNP